jgi:hypothetical protein
VVHDVLLPYPVQLRHATPPGQQTRELIFRAFLTLRATQHQTGPIDRQIDRLVYELYDLTEEEIAIVEEGSRHSNSP